jgi:Flp pilus assembly protein TadD
MNRGIAYSHNKQYDEAISDYNSAIALKVNYETAYFNRGISYIRKAAADFKKACDMNIQPACENLKQITD